MHRFGFCKILERGFLHQMLRNFTSQRGKRIYLSFEIACGLKLKFLVIQNTKKAFLLLANKVIVVTNSAPLLVFINICCYFIFLFTTKKFHFSQFIDFLKFLYYIGSKTLEGHLRNICKCPYCLTQNSIPNWNTRTWSKKIITNLFRIVPFCFILIILNVN